MRKLFFRLTMLVAVTALFTACDNDDNKPRKRIQFYSEGAFIVNSGNMYNKIDGSLTAIDYKTNQATQQVFKTANGVSLGNTPNDGLIYGSKIYVAVDQENTVEVIDKTTFKSRRLICWEPTRVSRLVTSQPTTARCMSAPMAALLRPSTPSLSRLLPNIRWANIPKAC